MKKKFLSTFLLIVIFLTPPLCVYSGDLDDGISKYTDDGIQKYDDLGKINRNIKYIKVHAKAKAKLRQIEGENQVQTGSKKGQANMNSVVLGAGGTVKGDIIIIDESKGAKTQIVDK